MFMLYRLFGSYWLETFRVRETSRLSPGTLFPGNIQQWLVARKEPGLSPASTKRDATAVA